MAKSKKSGRKKRRSGKQDKARNVDSAPAPISKQIEDVAARAPLPLAETPLEASPQPAAEEVVQAYYDAPATASPSDSTPAEERTEPISQSDEIGTAPALEEPAAPVADVKPILRGAALWRRLGAAFYDVLFLTLLCGGIIGFTIGWMFVSFAQPIDPSGNGFDPLEAKHYLLKAVLLCAVCSWLYSTLFESRWIGGTIGKLLFNLRVRDLDGRPISFLRANARFASKFITALTLGIGMLSGIFKANRQTLHDRISKTLVVHELS
ncbi:MAG: RDD family protein [Bdellovibrionota bacterium]